MPAGYWEARWTGFREGSTKLNLAWDGGSARAVAYEEGVPETTAAVLRLLPITVQVIHVAWSGDMLLTTEPVHLGITHKENEVKNMMPGDLAFDPPIDEITFTYGVAECHMPIGPNTIVVFGQIVEGLEEFAAFSRARRYEGVGELHLSLGE